MSAPTRRHARAALPDNALGLHLDWLLTNPPVALAAQLHARRTHPPETLVTVTHHAETLTRLVVAHGPVQAAARYVDVDPALRRDRIAVAVAMCAVAQVSLADRDGWPAPDRTLRPLSPIELGTVRLVSLPWLQRAAAVALTEQGATTTQTARVDPATDIHDTDQALQADLTATRGVVARTVPVADWATDVMRRATRHAIDNGHPLCLPATDTTGRGPRNITATLDRALAVAGIDATASSIRITHAHQLRTTHGPPAAAAALGSTSISSAMRLLDRAA